MVQEGDRGHRMWPRGQHQRHLTVQLLSRVPPFATPWTAACQAPLSFTLCWSLLKFMSIESVMLSNLSSSAAPSFSFELSQYQGLFR